MKKIRILPAALALCLALSACGGSGAASGSAADSTSADSSPADSTTTGDDAASGTDYSYLADFDYGALFDENGYVADVVASDYVTLPKDYAALTLPAGSDEVADEDVDTAIEEQLLTDFATTKPVTDRAAEMGDTVNIDYVGSVDGVEFDGGSTGGNGTDLELTGTNYIDDFEEQIAGHMPGETFNVEVTFPDPYKNNPDLAGKDAVFVTTLHYISEQVIPELTDSFVKENLTESTGWKTADEVRDYFRASLLYNKQSSAVYDILDAGVKYGDALPEPVDDYFRDYSLYNIYQYAQMYGVDMDLLLTQSGYENADQYLDDMQEGILSNGQSVLLVQALAEALDIVCDDDALSAHAEDVFGTDDLTDYESHYGKGYLKMLALEHLVMEELISNATIDAA